MNSLSLCPTHYLPNLALTSSVEEHVSSITEYQHSLGDESVPSTQSAVHNVAPVVPRVFHPDFVLPLAEPADARILRGNDNVRFFFSVCLAPRYSAPSAAARRSMFQTQTRPDAPLPVYDIPFTKSKISGNALNVVRAQDTEYASNSGIHKPLQVPRPFSAFHEAKLVTSGDSM